jgi:hypothetical protein
MADMRAFLARVDEQLDRLKSWQDELDAEVKRHREEIGQLKVKRSARLTELAGALLPDLKKATLDRLNEKLPDSLTAQQVSELRSAHVQALQIQKQDLLAKFDPATYRPQRLRLENDLEQEKGYRTSVESSLNNWMAIPGFRTLIERGYGTSRYSQSWLTLDFYRHWRRADEIAETFKVKDWAGVLAKYTELKDNSARMATTQADLEKQIAELDRNQQYLDELGRAAEHVDEAVLDKARTKLSGLLDTLARRPGWMSDLQELDASIAAQQKAIDEGLQSRRERIAQQSAQLQDIRLKAVRSRRRDVPDNYLNSLPVPTRSSGPTTVIIDSGRSDSFITDFIYYKTMMDFFDTPVHHDRIIEHHTHYDAPPRHDWSSPVSEGRVGRLS